MPHRFSMIPPQLIQESHFNNAVNAVIVTGSSIVAALAPILAAGDDKQVNEEMRVLLIPLAAAVLISGAMVMLNPNKETIRIIIGRCAFSLLGGAIGPTLLSICIPMFSGIDRHPVLLLALGGISAALVYAIARAATREAFNRADGIAKRQADIIEQKYLSGVQVVEKNTAATELNSNLLSKRINQEEEHSAPTPENPMPVMVVDKNERL